MSDGLATDRSKLPAIVHQVKSSGIVVYTVGIGRRIDVAEIANMATDNKHVLTVADFNQLDKIVSTLQTRLCSYGKYMYCTDRSAHFFKNMEFCCDFVKVFSTIIDRGNVHELYICR
jgi:hypothetical protein